MAEGLGGTFIVRMESNLGLMVVVVLEVSLLIILVPRRSHVLVDLETELVCLWYG